MAEGNSIFEALGESMGRKRTKCQSNEDSRLRDNAKHAMNSATAVLNLNFSRVVPSRANQFTVGWLRAAFTQSRVIIGLYLDGQGHHSAPNRRNFWELALRLLWLHNVDSADREGALNTMLSNDRWYESQTHRYLNGMNLHSDIDIKAMEEILLAVSPDKDMREQARQIAKAAKSLHHQGAHIYRLWRQDSAWTHASGFLAGQYAPVANDTLSAGQPRVIDPDLSIHRLVGILIAFVASGVLLEEGAPRDLAMSPFTTLMET